MIKKLRVINKLIVICIIICVAYKIIKNQNGNIYDNIEVESKLISKTFKEISSRELGGNERPTEEFVCTKLRIVKNLIVCSYKKRDVVSDGVKSGGWEKSTSLFFFDIFQILEGAIFFDIGSNIGMHSMSASISNSKAVWALDGVRNAALILYQSSQKSQVKNKMRIFNTGIAPLRGNFTLQENKDGNVGGSRLLNKDSGGVQIPTYTLNDYLNYLTSNEKIPQTIVIKMDIESMECKTILSSIDAFHTSKWNIPIIVIEWIFHQFPNTECPVELENKVKLELTKSGYVPYNLMSKKKMDINVNWKYALLDVVWYKEKDTAATRVQNVLRYLP